jgi:hypothetical protein
MYHDIRTLPSPVTVFCKVFLFYNQRVRVSRWRNLLRHFRCYEWPNWYSVQINYVLVVYY